MIIDTLDNLKRYSGIAKSIDRAIAFVSQTDLLKLEIGRIEIDGNEVYALVQSYESRPRESFQFEAHRNYIDLQIVAEGYESMLWAPEDTLEVAASYDAEKDAALYNRSDSVELAMRPNWFCIFFPEDAHQPGCRTADKAWTVRKIVIKCRIGDADKR